MKKLGILATAFLSACVYDSMLEDAEETNNTHTSRCVEECHSGISSIPGSGINACIDLCDDYSDHCDQGCSDMEEMCEENCRDVGLQCISDCFGGS